MAKEMTEYAPGAARQNDRFRLRYVGKSGNAMRVVFGSLQIDALMIVGSGAWDIRSRRDLGRAICEVRGMEYSSGWANVGLSRLERWFKVPEATKTQRGYIRRGRSAEPWGMREQGERFYQAMCAVLDPTEWEPLS